MIVPSIRTVAALLLFMGASLNADELSTARTLFQQKDYQGVQEALAPLLEQVEPPIEALELSFRAARASGQIYTAERRVRPLMERVGESQPIWIYEGAMLARDLGDEARSLDRLMFYVRTQKQASSELERALQELCVRGTEPLAFDLYVQRFGTGKARFSLGMNLLKRLRSENLPDAMVEMSGILVKHFSDPTLIEQVHKEMREALNGKLYGLKRNEVYVALLSGNPGTGSELRQMVDRHSMGYSDLLSVMENTAEPMDGWWLYRLRDMEREKNPTIRKSYAQRLLRLEPKYRQKGDAELYRAYLAQVIGKPGLFFQEDERWISEQQVEEMFRHATSLLKPEDQQRIRWLGERLLSENRDTPRRFVENKDRRRELLRSLPHAFRGSELLELTNSNRNNADTLNALLQLTGNRLDVRMAALPQMVKADMKDAVLSTVRDELITRPTHFDDRQLAREFLSAGQIPVEEKVALLKQVHQQTGNSKRLKELANHRDNKLRKSSQIMQFVSSLDETRTAKDPVLRILLEMVDSKKLLKGKEPSKELNRKIEEAFDAYGKAYPDPASSAERNAYMARILHLYRNTADNSNEGRRAYARVVAPHLSRQANWQQLIDFSIHANRNDGDSAFYIAKAYLPLSKQYLQEFSLLTYPESREECMLLSYYSEMTSGDLATYIARNRVRLPASLRALQLKQALGSDTFVASAGYNVGSVIYELRQGATQNSALPLQELRQAFLQPRADGTYAGTARIRDAVYDLHKAAQKYAKALAHAEQHAAKASDPADAVRVLLAGLYSDREPPREPRGALKPGHSRHVLIQTVLPLLEKMNPMQLNRLYIHNDLVRHVNWLMEKDNSTPEHKKSLGEVEMEFARALASGAGHSTTWRDIDDAILRTYRNAVQENDIPGLLDQTLLTSRMATSEFSEGYAKAMIEPLVENGHLEPLLLLTSVVTKGEPAALMALNQARGLASSQVTGVYPVEKSDPAYPLFLAADEFSRNNRERAWTLLRENLEAFSEDPLRFPPEFTAWALNRLREVRGEGDVWRDRSRDLSNRVLTRDTELIPDLKAAVMLNRAELFRDEKNFEAARLEYQSIRQNPDLQKTPAGRQAMFRDVDLMIAMGNESSAENLIEYWLATPDPELQIKAHYFRALLAFQAGDDERTREELDKVFALDFTNAEARLLHGKWRLRTNYEVDNPEVLLGTLRDRTILRPGQPLRISVRDENLSVVGGGSAIPVIVRTSRGQDLEKLNLFPSTRDPKLFRGSIDTMLGAVSPENRVLEVNGMDVVSYEIDPTFLSTRGMSSSEPKQLRIVDDARLAVSAGNILTEAEQQELEIEQQMNVSGGPSQGRNIRPGNPFYVMVRDQDRSSGEIDNTIQVSVETSSGDRLNRLPLKEVAPYTGEFRAEVTTALPPPRASASDTAEGLNPGVVINRQNSGIWRSKADGASGKWLKADSMASHLLQRSELLMPDATAVKELVLHGSLFGEEIVLGTFPKRRVPGGGISLQTTGTTLRTLEQYREHFSSQTKTPIQVEGFRFDAPSSATRFHLRGAFWMKEAQELSLKVIALQPGQEYAMKDLWITLLINGEKVVSGRGSDLVTQGVQLSLPSGGHILEIFGYTRAERDSFELGVEYPDGSVEPIPSSWFSITENPELDSFLEDKVILTQNQDRWVATFKEPMRLRSLRWEFIRYTGDAVEVSEIRMQDNKGALVLPADNDFSMALNNDQLEVAPGDRVTVTYLDAITSEGSRRPLSQQLGSSFTNGEIGFYFEELTATDSGMARSLNSAYRFRPGDDFLVVVTDSDLDVSPDADRVEIQVRSRSGETLVLSAVEVRGERDAEDAPVHSGRFQALLRTRSDAATGGDTMRVGSGDRVVASYTDTENTSPGIPADREISLESVQQAEPFFTFYHTWREREIDTGPEAEATLNQIRGRSGNQSISEVYRWSLSGQAMSEEEMLETPLLINTDVPMPIQVYLPSEAMHSGSTLVIKASALSEGEAARAEGRDPVVFESVMGLGRAGGGLRIRRTETGQDTSVLEENATFAISLPLSLGSATGLVATADVETPTLSVRGNDEVTLTIETHEGTTLAERRIQLVSEGVIDLMDSGFEAGRRRIHLGERFFVVVYDSDQDKTALHDEVTVTAVGSRSGNQTELVLKETLPHSGIFTGVLMPRFESEEQASSDNPMQVLEANEAETTEPDALAGIPTLGVVFGESIEFQYQDEDVPPLQTAGTRSVTGELFEGSDASLLAFTKYFSEPDMAVRVQFRLAESLFEMAKDYRKLKQTDKSSESIAEGKRILEEALASHPDSELAVEGEYLLANLYQEMAAELDSEEDDTSRTYYQEALARFSSLLSSYPDSEFAARAQYHKALCLEKLGDFTQASEEYVKMTYIFPESPLVGDAAIRLATHYYKNEQRFDTAGKIYANFHSRFPSHPLAAKALFMSAQCHLKQGDVWEQERIAEGISGDKVRTERILDEYRSAVKALESLINDPATSSDKEIRSQAMYWAGDASLRAMDYANAYLFLKRVTFEYPDSEWARRSRGLLLQSAEYFEELQ